MNWFKQSNLARMNNRVWSTALLAVVSLLVAHRSTAQAMQKGISVELVPTSSAVAVPDADKPEALIVAVTNTGKLYFGIDPVTPGSLAEKLKSRTSSTQNLYIKADARAPYASVVKVLDAAHTAGIAGVTLLTTHPTTAQAGGEVSPEGIEMELGRRPRTETR